MTTPLSPPTVAVHATAERSVPPDRFVITAVATATAADANAAAALLTSRFTELEAAIAALGADVEVDRGPVSRHADRYHLDKTAPGQVVWHAARSMTLTGRDTSQVADVVGALGRIESIEIQGPHWQLDRDNPVHAELAAEAVHEAAARAGRYATALGGALGRLVELSDVGMSGGGRAVMAMRASAYDQAGLETLDYTPKPIDVSASVEARWYLTLD